MEREEPRDEPHVQYRDKPQDDSQDESQDEPRHESRERSQEEPQDEAQEEPKEEPPEPLCPWLSPQDLVLIGDLGLPDPFHWGNMIEWTETFLLKYDAGLEDTRTVRHRFIRARCILCGDLCEGKDMNTIIDPPVALPCGHIMGWTCYAEFSENYLEMDGTYECPWNGPRIGDPDTWSPVCEERIVHDCAHSSIFARIPPPTEEFYLPPGFFTPANGFVTAKCRKCTVDDLLLRWTHEAREDGQFPYAFATCGRRHGLLEGEIPGYGPLVEHGLQDDAELRSQLLEELFGSTPTPMDGDVLKERTTVVIFYKASGDPAYNRLSVGEVPDEEGGQCHQCEQDEQNEQNEQNRVNGHHEEEDQDMQDGQQEED
ncbi:hypothetical protein EDB81DRAFT_878078 [Dactylonectria macrodidyma]|uniref:Uncharacterized protein n=1 Tax=Dactylonectria macrodidyma TaxID=307937 RepID=A0A9P9JFX2_9HYPO|nr:hypothetical protein EDB81DRAFT_878078 [Dactylonectria macrodidyma]